MFENGGEMYITLIEKEMVRTWSVSSIINQECRPTHCHCTLIPRDVNLDPILKVFTPWIRICILKCSFFRSGS